MLSVPKPKGTKLHQGFGKGLKHADVQVDLPKWEIQIEELEIIAGRMTQQVKYR